MAIKVKIHDNDSQIKVKPIDNTDEIKLKSDCGLKERVLDAKINKEIEDRENADAILQEEIDEIAQKTPEVDNATIVINDENKIALNQILNANYLVVDTIEDRDAIPKELLKKGTLVRVDSTSIVYRWDLINWNKTPVNITSLGNGLKLSPEGELSVDVTDEAVEENQQPITSNGVYNILGDINVRLEQI